MCHLLGLAAVYFAYAIDAAREDAVARYLPCANLLRIPGGKRRLVRATVTAVASYFASTLAY